MVRFFGVGCTAFFGVFSGFFGFRLRVLHAFFWGSHGFLRSCYALRFLFGFALCFWSLPFFGFFSGFFWGFHGFFWIPAGLKTDTKTVLTLYSLITFKTDLQLINPKHFHPKP